MTDRRKFSCLIFIFSISVFAEIPQQSETTLSPPIRHFPWVPLLGSQMAPSVNSTEGPAGRPNLELVPLSTGVLNSLTPSMRGANPDHAKERKGSAQGQKKMPLGSETEISREATSPLPHDLNKGADENPAAQGRQNIQ